MQREQYSITVHLFIGTRYNPDKITFMSLIFTLNHNVSYQGLSSLFPLMSDSFLIFVIILSQSSFSHSFSAIHITFGLCLHIAHAFTMRENLHPKVEASCNSLCHTENI
jgi:hypothetical protein